MFSTAAISLQNFECDLMSQMRWSRSLQVGRNDACPRTQKVRQGAGPVPLQGVYNVPNCGTNDDDPEDQPTAMCLTMQALIARGAYLPVVRDHLVQAQYFKVRSCPSPSSPRCPSCWVSAGCTGALRSRPCMAGGSLHRCSFHSGRSTRKARDEIDFDRAKVPVPAPQDPWRLEAYLASNPFLPDINNEFGTKNVTYAASLASLERLVLYRFQNEYTVVPRGRCVTAFGRFPWSLLPLPKLLKQRLNAAA